MVAAVFHITDFIKMFCVTVMTTIMFYSTSIVSMVFSITVKKVAKVFYITALTTLVFYVTVMTAMRYLIRK